MSETKHTPEPWLVLDCREIGEDALTVAANPGVAVCRIENSVSKRPLTDEDAANARRIVACVNVFKGLSTDEIETIPVPLDQLARDYRTMRRQRDDLLAALEFAREKIAELHIEAGDGNCHYPLIDDAIARAEGGAA